MIVQTKILLVAITAAFFPFVYFWILDPRYAELLIFMGYMTLSTTFLAFPHEPVIIYYASVYGPIIPALLAIIPTLVGSFLDYGILSPVLNHTVLEKYKSKSWYGKIIPYFTIFPFVTIFFCAITPLPFYPVRLLSIISSYSLLKYSIAVILGKIPRFLLIAAGGKLLNLDDKLIILIFIIFILVYIVSIVYKRFLQNKFLNLLERR